METRRARHDDAVEAARRENAAWRQWHKARTRAEEEEAKGYPPPGVKISTQVY